MRNPGFPINLWGLVLQQPADSRVQRVRIEASESGGWLILTEEPTGAFDDWVETQDEVLDYLGTLSVDWDKG